MAYIFSADVYCDACGAKLARSLRACVCPQAWGGGAEEPRPDSKRRAPECLAHGAEASEDSDEFPQSVPESQCETDSPDHCAACGEYLAHPLTAHGIAYVAQSAREYVRGEHPGTDALAEWCADLLAYDVRGMARAWISAAFDLSLREGFGILATLRTRRGSPETEARYSRAVRRLRDRRRAYRAALLRETARP